MSSALTAIDTPFTLDADTTLRIARYTADDEALSRAATGTTLWTEACHRFRAPKRRWEWVAGRLLLLQMGIEPRRVAYLPSGKPYLTDSSMYISLSHTTGYVAAMLSTTPCGVDIERRSDRVLRVRDRIVDAAFPLPTNDTDAMVRTLLICWSAKESLYKCMDEVGTDFRRELHLAPFTAQQSGEIAAHETRTPQQQHFVVNYHTGADYVLTTARCSSIG